MGKKDYKPEEHGYMPLPPVDDEGELMMPFNQDEQINLRDKFAPWDHKPSASEMTQAATAAPVEAESLDMLESLTDETETMTAAPEAPQIELDASVVASGASETLATKLQTLGLAAKARAGAATDKIRQNPTAVIASVAGAAIVILLVVLTFVWTRPAGETVPPDMIANGEEQEPGFPDGDNQAEVEPTYIADLLCRADKSEDTLYGFKGFQNLAVERRVTFTAQNVPHELFVSNIFTFANPLDVAPKTTEYKKLFDKKYPENARGFLVSWASTKAAGIQMSLSTHLRNSALTDEQLLQFGLAPDQNADGTLTARYAREEIEARWVAEGFRCMVDKGADAVANK